MGNFRNSEHFEMEIKIPTDEEGYLGRRCPNPDCGGYFKITLGTGLEGDNLPCLCPYCGHSDDPSEFTTPEQLDYVKSVAGRTIMKAFYRDLKKLEFDIKPKGAFGIGFSMKLEPLRLQPLRTYGEKALETHIECAECGLRYAVYGVFAFCPNCGQHNSLQILEGSFGTVTKLLDLASTAPEELGQQLIQNALEDCVSAFDGFGRETCRVHDTRLTDKGKSVSFQNVEQAEKFLKSSFGFDLSSSLDSSEWGKVIQGFQKRHVLAHKMGVVDEDYMRKSRDAEAVVGRKVKVSSEEVRELTVILSKLAHHMTEMFRKRQEGLPPKHGGLETTMCDP